MDESNKRVGLVRSHTDLDVYKQAFALAMNLFRESKSFPSEEKYSLTDQMRRASRSVCVNLAEAWRKRRYEAAFVAKLSDCESEAAETQVWIQFAVECDYLNRDAATSIYEEYNEVIGMLVSLINDPKPWLLNKASRT